MKPKHIFFPIRKCTKMDRSGHKWTKWNEVDRMGTRWTELNLSGPNRTEVD